MGLDPTLPGFGRSQSCVNATHRTTAGKLIPSMTVFVTRSLRQPSSQPFCFAYASIALTMA